MRSATVDEAKEHLEELIAAARSGETVEITSQGRTVASLEASGHLQAGSDQSPSSNVEDVDWDARLAKLEARGLISRSKLTEAERAEVARMILEPLRGAGPSGVLDALLEERREGR